MVPPILHGVHRNVKGALGSFFARVLIPSATGLLFLGRTGSSCGSGYCSGDPVAAGMGLLVGAIAVASVDSIFWARTLVPAPPLSLALVPYHDGARLALGARF